MDIRPLSNFEMSSNNEVGDHISYYGKGYMDYTKIDGNVVTVRGWGLITDDNENLKLPNQFFICLDTQVIGKCSPNVERHDVVSSLSLDTYFLPCGFEATFELGDVAGVLNALSLHLSDNKNGLVPLPGPYACILPESPLHVADENDKYTIIDKMHTICCQLTSKCNLRCKYCFITSKDYEEGEITNDILSKFMEAKDRYSIVEICYGIMGEPTTRDDFFEIVKKDGLVKSQTAKSIRREAVG